MEYAKGGTDRHDHQGPASSGGSLRKLGSVATDIVRISLVPRCDRDAGSGVTNKSTPLGKTPTLQAHSKQHDDWEAPAHEEDPTA
ncbi:MAG: hypothetical protein ACLUNZ_12920 [Evtepia sp.]